MSLPPLEDPGYEPAYKPINGKAPDVVAKWGAASQLRWFDRFWPELGMSSGECSIFFCQSEQHRGVCCSSCIEDQECGYFDMTGCCCRAER